MLFLRQVKHLAKHLDTSPKRLDKVLSRSDDCYEALILRDPAHPEDDRKVVNVTGPIREFQSLLYRRLLLRKLNPSVHSHGGVTGRSIKTNAEAHQRSSYVFKTDIADFYPSIHHKRVYRLFAQGFACSPDVARLCTRLCTYRNHLALGLITSPMLADQVLRPVDDRIGAACAKAGLVYTRYVDDVAISGNFDLEKSGFERTVSDILTDHGFRVNDEKNGFGRLTEGTAITGVRRIRGHLDARKEYIRELERQLDDAIRLARGESFDGPYYTPAQIRGRVEFVCWINPGRRRRLMRKYRSIPWDRVVAEAKKRGLVAPKKQLLKPEAETVS